MNDHQNTSTIRRRSSRGWIFLVTAIAIVVAVWGWVLPQLEQTEVVRKRGERLKRHGIDPAAFFYTDHEGMNDWQIGAQRLPNGDAHD